MQGGAVGVRVDGASASAPFCSDKQFLPEDFAREFMALAVLSADVLTLGLAASGYLGKDSLSGKNSLSQVTF
jgi:hypothetical protein